MTKLGLALAVVVSLSGCGGKKTKAPDCDAALANAMSISSKEMKLDAATTAKLKDISLARCKEDKWSDEALACITAAKTGGDLGTCEQKQTPDQRDKLKKALEVMAPPEPDTGSATEPAGSGSAGSGSAGSGSAGSGSAGSGSAGSAAGSGSGSAGSGVPAK